MVGNCWEAVFFAALQVLVVYAAGFVMTSTIWMVRTPALSRRTPYLLRKSYSFLRPTLTVPVPWAIDAIRSMQGGNSRNLYVEPALKALPRFHLLHKPLHQTFLSGHEWIAVVGSD